MAEAWAEFAERFNKTHAPAGSAAGGQFAAATDAIAGQIEMADQVASAGLAEATQADDHWAVGWALHVLANTAAMRGRMADALPLFDRALAVTEAEPALTDLRLLELFAEKAKLRSATEMFEELRAGALGLKERDGSKQSLREPM